MIDPLAGGFRIGDHAVEPARGRIVSPAGEIHVEPRAMDVLVALARKAGDTIGRDELIESVWKHPHVSDEALSRCISLLRHALGDDRSQPRFLETIPKRGYRLIAPVQLVARAPAVAEPPRRPGGGGAVPDPTRTNLGLQPTRIIGRERELAEVRALLARQRLVTLTGSGGVGKTRLALELGANSIGEFADGVWLVELAPLSDPESVPNAVAAVLGLELNPTKAPLSALAQGVSSLDALLLLDNCEHLIDAAAQLVDAILAAAPRVHLLATSQLAIRVAGEQVYPVPALEVPHHGLWDVDRIVDSASAQLFVERAKAADPHFELTDRNAAGVAAICRRLEGIPLAIEMAAARAPMLGVEQLAQRLDERFRVLTDGWRTALPRHQTLRATLDWSFGLLSAHEQAVLCHLAVFAGGFTLEAAMAVAADDDIAPSEVADLLADLMARSLVATDTGAGERRYRLLETTRAYALEKLNESGRAREARTRHLDFYLALAAEAEPKLRSAEQGDWFTRLDQERENCLTAHAWCGQSDKHGQAGLELVADLKGYFIHRGGLRLGYMVTQEALARPTAQRRSRARCRTLRAAALFGTTIGRHAEVLGYREEALSIARELGDDLQLAWALMSMGEHFILIEQWSEARRWFREALLPARRTGNVTTIKAVLQSTGDLDRLEGDLDTAEQAYEQVLTLVRGGGDGRDLVITFGNLATVSIARGSGERAPEMLLDALALVDQVGSKVLGAHIISLVAALATFTKSWHRAARLYGAGSAQREELGYAIEPADAAFLEPMIARTRNALGKEPFASIEAEGRALSYETAIAEAGAWLRESEARRARIA